MWKLDTSYLEHEPLYPPAPWHLPGTLNPAGSEHLEPDQRAERCRSVLPSASRKNARQNRRIAHGANRAAERAVLRWRRHGEDEGTLSDAERRRRSAVRDMVWDRRSADKIGPLVRWARVTAERHPWLREASREEVLAFFAGLLPDNTIGRHAVQHIEYGLFGYAFGLSIS